MEKHRFRDLGNCFRRLGSPDPAITRLAMATSTRLCERMRTQSDKTRAVHCATNSAKRIKQIGFAAPYRSLFHMSADVLPPASCIINQSACRTGDGIISYTFYCVVVIHCTFGANTSPQGCVVYRRGRLLIRSSARHPPPPLPHPSYFANLYLAHIVVAAAAAAAALAVAVLERRGDGCE